MKYLFEKDVGIPLCAYKDNNYIDLFTGEIITSPNKLEFINKYLENKKIIIQNVKVEIMKINLKESNKLIGYAYIVDNISYFLDNNLNLFDSSKLEFINKQLADDKYILETLWK